MCVLMPDMVQDESKPVSALKEHTLSKEVKTNMQILMIWSAHSNTKKEWILKNEKAGAETQITK